MHVPSAIGEACCSLRVSSSASGCTGLLCLIPSPLRSRPESHSVFLPLLPDPSVLCVVASRVGAERVAGWSAALPWNPCSTVHAGSGIKPHNRHGCNHSCAALQMQCKAGSDHAVQAAAQHATWLWVRYVTQPAMSSPVPSSQVQTAT